MSENPPAFPSRRDLPLPGGGSYRDDLPGMTLRDYFAGQALAGMADVRHLRGGDDYKYAAKYAYRFADAMLAARKETPDGA